MTSEWLLPRPCECGCFAIQPLHLNEPPAAVATIISDKHKV